MDESPMPPESGETVEQGESLKLSNLVRRDLSPYYFQYS